jgi:tetratricopeptide (TPR) repeat protein
VIALLWTVHPLQVESVTYIAQRAESLAGLFFLLTFYGFVRGADGEEGPGRSAGPWFWLAAWACVAGMATKETMVTCPVLVFLYDRTFVSGSFKAAWQRHRRLHLGLMATWLLLAWLVGGTGGNRGGSIGFGVAIPWWQYALSQFRAVAMYLKLAFWPSPLVFDYGTEWARSAADVVPYAVVVLALLGATVWALRRRPVLGFLGAWFFVILAPTSSIVPGIRQTAAEHRMYLPLAALIGISVVAAGGWLLRRDRRVLAAALATVLALAAVSGTLGRNYDYRTEEAIWADTVAKHPANEYAHYNLGVVLYAKGDPAGAVVQYREALRIQPDYAEAHNNLGIALTALGRTDEGAAEYREAIRLRPRFAQAHNNLGNFLAQTNRVPEAIMEFEEALRLQPDYPDAELNLGIALEQAGQLEGAVARYREVLRRRPEYGDAHDDLGNALVQLHRVPEAIHEYQAALQVNPRDAEAYNSLGGALIDTGQLPEAIANLQQALRIRPAYAEARRNLGDALARAGRIDEAIAAFQEAIRIRPGYAEAHASLGNALVGAQRLPEAVAEYQQALRLAPDDAATHNNLGGTLAELGRFGEAGYEFQAALRLKPDYADAQRNLARLRSLQRAPGP